MKNALCVSGILSSICFVGCAVDPAPDAPTGALSTALALRGPTHDVTAFHFKILPFWGDCGAEAIAETTVELETENLPTHLAFSGDQHAFADGLFVLPAGSYRICTTPLQADGAPSVECAPSEDTADVVAGQTTEILMISQCVGNPGGGLDVIVVLNDPPRIDGLDIDASKFITTCEEATITVSASDPNGDDLTYSWWQLSGPEDGLLVQNGATATFSAPVAGDYLLEVWAVDLYGAGAPLSFPIHVSGDACETTPNQCATGSDPGTGDGWIICEADENGAWLSSFTSGGVYHADLICQQLGYGGVGASGGNCGSVCGYCDVGTTCENHGNQIFDGGGECGSDELGALLCFTVTWQCVP